MYFILFLRCVLLLLLFQLRIAIKYVTKNNNYNKVLAGCMYVSI